MENPRRIHVVVYTTPAKRAALKALARRFGESVGRLHDRFAKSKLPPPPTEPPT